jgi:hypothetical protein
MNKIRIKNATQVPEIIEWLDEYVGQTLDVTKQYDQIESVIGEGWQIVRALVSYPASDAVLRILGFQKPNEVSSEHRNNLYPKAIHYYVIFDDESYAVQFKLSHD